MVRDESGVVAVNVMTAETHLKSHWLDSDTRDAYLEALGVDKRSPYSYRISEVCLKPGHEIYVLGSVIDVNGDLHFDYAPYISENFIVSDYKEGELKFNIGFDAVRKVAGIAVPVLILLIAGGQLLLDKL